MRMSPLTSVVVLGSLFLMTACTVPKLGVVSVKPVETGREYELVNSAASASHSLFFLFGVPLGADMSYAQLIDEMMKDNGCDVMKDVGLEYPMMIGAGFFGVKITNIWGDCFKLK